MTRTLRTVVGTAVGAAVGAAVLLVGPGTVAAGARAGKRPPKPAQEIIDVGTALQAFVLGEMYKIRVEFQDDTLVRVPPPPAEPAAVEEALEDIVEEIEMTRGEWFDLLTGANRQLSEKVEEVKAKDPEAAAAQSGAGYGTAGDQLSRAERIATGKLRFGLGKTLAAIRKDFEEAGRPVAIVGPILPDPTSAVLFPPGPHEFPMGLIVGSCNGTATVLTLDPAYAQGPGIDTSYIQFVGPDSPDVAAELEMKSGVDFVAGEPFSSSVFEFSGLAPGTYVVEVGVVKDGVRARVSYESVTIPDWGGAQIDPDAALAAKVRKAGASLRRFVRREGSALVREVKSELRRAADEDEAYAQFAETMRAAYGRIGELKLTHRDQWWSQVDLLRTTDPDVADFETTAGTRSSGDRVQADEQAADDLWRTYCDKAKAAAAKAFARLNRPIAYVTSAGRTPHPAADRVLNSTGPQSFFGGMWVTARCNGDVRVEMVDARDGDEVDRMFVEIREADTRTLVLRREVTDDDVDDDGIGLVEDDALLQEGRTYDVRLVSGGDPPFATLDAVVVTCPNWRAAEPTPACTVTSFTATIGGSAYTVPPFDNLRVQIIDGKFYGMSVRYANPSSSIVPQFNFLMSPTTFVDVADLTNAETVVSKPPASPEALSYFYFPSQIKLTSEVSATYRIRNLKSFVTSGGCMEADVDGVYAEWQGMTMVPFSVRLTMSAADVTQ